jgi:hypothetical protein
MPAIGVFKMPLVGPEVQLLYACTHLHGPVAVGSEILSLQADG